MMALTLSDENIGLVTAAPPLVWRVVEPGDPAPYLRELGYGPPGLLARLLGRKREPPPIPQLRFDGSELREVHLEKSWDGLNFCLRQLVPPGSCKNLFDDGRPVGKVEVYCGPALAFDSGEVARIAACYRSLTGADLLAKFRPADMKGVYPESLWRSTDPDVTSYIVDNFADLKAFLQQAVDDGLGILVLYT